MYTWHLSQDDASDVPLLKEFLYASSFVSELEDAGMMLKRTPPLPCLRWSRLNYGNYCGGSDSQQFLALHCWFCLALNSMTRHWHRSTVCTNPLNFNPFPHQNSMMAGIQSWVQLFTRPFPRSHSLHLFCWRALPYDVNAHQLVMYKCIQISFMLAILLL